MGLGRGERYMRAIIWGCGVIGKRVFIPLIEYHHMKIAAYTDSSPKMWGCTLQYTNYTTM